MALSHLMILGLVTLAFLLPHVACAQGAPAASHTFVIGDKDFLLDGKPLQIRCGEVHFTRVPRAYWDHRLKMAKAMGLNAVCVYLFWNKLEWKEGQFDWSGENAAAEFCRLAQQNGLWVILRPGPYVCSEWDGGGLPWWLLKNPTIKLRTQDPAFVGPATAYFKEVGRVLGPLQVTHGGPILMAQVENEYGSYGKDVDYMGTLRQALIDSGFDIPLFACNPAGAIHNGLRADLFQAVNFGHDPQNAFKTLRAFQSTGPLMNGEFYPGWFDSWGEPHRKGNSGQYLSDLEYMLKNDMSFSIYMAHGGTSWGLWSGADQPFRMDTTSYDYDAPISEAGWVTDKFTKTRELISKYLLPGETLPEPPPQNPVITVDSFTLTEAAPIFNNLPAPTNDDQPKTMEQYDQGHGCIDYRTTVPAGPAATLSVGEVHDFAWIFLNEKQVGVMDRRRHGYSVPLPARTSPSQLDILIEAVGRVNFGPGIHDRKGLHGPVQLAGQTAPLQGWQVYSLPLDDAELAVLKYQPAPVTGPAFWHGGFDLTQTGDTFLDMHGWGKGVVWVNGHCLGRFWDIGPTQTMYTPGPWLKTGHNDVVVLDLVGPREPKLAGLAKPVLDELHPEFDFSRKARATGAFSVDKLTPAQAGSFSAATDAQEVHFATLVTGRYLCLQALNAIDGKPLASVAELEAFDASGHLLPRTNWKLLWVDSEEEGREGENALDGQASSQWDTAHSGPPCPHEIVIDLGQNTTVDGIRYLPSSDPKNPGHIKDYRVYVSDHPFGLISPP
jgi:beta-galactosidase